MQMLPMQTHHDHSTFRRLPLLALVGATFALGGCGDSNRLETGYRYQPLGSTSVERRAFYADPFSEEAMRGEAQSDQLRRRGPLSR